VGVIPTGFESEQAAGIDHDARQGEMVWTPPTSER
jgi:hypothetical protein